MGKGGIGPPTFWLLPPPIWYRARLCVTIPVAVKTSSMPPHLGSQNVLAAID